MTRHLRRGLAFGLALGVGSVLCSLLPRVLEVDESVGLGALFALRGPLRVPDDVAVISISRDSAGAVGQSSELLEWPRTLHAELIDALAAAGAAVIVFDVYFEKPHALADDRRLAAAIEAAGNVILLERVETSPAGKGSTFTGVIDHRLPVLPEFAAGALAIAPFTLPSVPIRIGQFWTFGRAADDTPSLPVAALQAYLRSASGDLAGLLAGRSPQAEAALRAVADSRSREFVKSMRAVRGEFQRDPALATGLAGLLSASDAPSAAAQRALLDVYGGRSSRYLNFYGPPRTVRTLPYDQVLLDAAHLDLAGKVVFVGFSERRQPEQRDWFYSVFSQRSGANLSGVEIGATAFANLLEGRTLTPLSMPLHLLFVLGLGVVLGSGVAGLSIARAFAVTALSAACYGVWVYWRFAAAAVWWPLVVPLGLEMPLALGAAVFWNYRDLARQRLRVQRALGYYVPSDLVERLAEQSVSLDANRQLLHGTCLVTDAEDYTAVAESLSPDAVRDLLNAYYKVMFDVVTKHGGAVSDAAGDSMVAIWTTAKPDSATRVQACRAALDIASAIDDFNRRGDHARLPTRIGLESGELLLGNIGAEGRFEYRAIGDIVNTAARIQSLNRELGTRVLVSAATLDGAAAVAGRDLGSFLLRGKRQPVRVWEPFADGAGGCGQAGLAEAFALGLQAFEHCEWSRARRLFETLLASYPGDGPATFYARLAADYESRPPAHWPGAIVITTK